ncbi:RICIN domain-containing protein [Streptomyces barringtoniae]|uniref:RICIN domain-containing protein n=1 Tax=Streptomyces barringtoniae TaxID=2892029 RepID=UPI001E5E63D2|nr:RICIN domain-containing protein [Streptomyces barringtoniae]MCC5474111.1 RICIN domain-containing protein [Streptomyces barringtoniae]
MQPPHPPRPPYPPLPGSPGESDRDLVARLGGPHSVRHHAVALLLARHWRAARDYAVVCLASAGPVPQLVATAAFHEVLGRLAGGAAGGALRPHLLVAVRDTVRAWAADDVACATLPELRKPAGGRGLRATNPGTPERRQLAERAFQALPGASQCLLWHTEVEAEPINIPAGLLGIDPVTATAALEQAREQFRAGCVRGHRELAPSRECRFYNRLLDVPMRRGGALLPEVRQHLTACPCCRYAAETFGLFDGGLGLLLAETVLGWGARRYLDSRPGRGAAEELPCGPAPAPVAPGAGGRHRTGPGGRHRTALVVGVGLASLALLATVLVARSWSDDNGVPVPGATWGAPAGHSTHAEGTGTRAATSSTAPAGEGDEVAHGGLRALASGRCLAVRGDGVRAGAGVGLAPCAAAASQQWSYQDDGLLRSAVDPSLCLAADPGTRSVVLAGCVVHAGEVAYDITVRGEILPRRHVGLALAPDSGDTSARVTLVPRDGSPEQLWVLEPAAEGAGAGRPDAAQGGADAPGGRQPGFSQGDGPEQGDGSLPGEGAPKGVGLSKGGTEGPPHGNTSRGKPEGTGSGAGVGESGETRVAQVRAGHDRRRTGSVSPARAVRAVHRALPPVTGTVAAVPATVGTLLR